jgi:hypothetical protein
MDGDMAYDCARMRGFQHPSTLWRKHLVVANVKPESACHRAAGRLNRLFCNPEGNSHGSPQVQSPKESQAPASRRSTKECGKHGGR